VQPLSDPSKPSVRRPVDPSWSRTAVRLGGNVVTVVPDRAATLQVAPPRALPAGKSCTCGHGKRVHEHYRRGTDCALCGCGRFRRPVLGRLMGR
jgi:hypothetical protein